LVFANINKIERALAKLTKRRKEKIQISKIRDEKGDITIGNNEIQKIIWEYFENLYLSKLENGKMDKFLDTYDPPKLNQKVINKFNRSVTSNEIEIVIKNLPKKEKSRS
jgi:MFS superfamily sulfate permease-like transporter